MQGRSTRAAAAEAAWNLIDEAIAGFLGRQAGRAAVPTIVALRRRFEAIREEILAERPADASSATRLLINRLLHDPSARLRAMAANSPDEQVEAEKVLARLFRLNQKGEGGREDEDGKE